MANGYIKLERSLLEKAIFRNEKLLKVWVWCLLKASHKQIEIMVGRRKIKLLPGQFITGRNAAAEELNLPPSTVRDYLYLLKKNNSLDITSDSKWTVVTIVNWALYQTEQVIPDSKSDSRSTMNGHSMDTNKNVKNDKNVKKVITPLTPLNKNSATLFEKFWEAYPKKRAKGQAEKTWSKINPDEQLTHLMLSVIERAKTSVDWTKENGQFIPHPSTWLNAKGWEDEYKSAGLPQPQHAREPTDDEKAVDELYERMKQDGRFDTTPRSGG